MPDARRRALFAVAAGLLGAALGIAGAGHAYLGEWRRAVAWFSFVLGAALVLVSVLADPRTVTLSSLPPEVAIPVAGLLVLSAADAYRVATYQARGGLAASPSGTASDAAAPDDDPPSCPNCGRAVDPSMNFCWYCAEPVEAASDAGGDVTAR
ncbi:MAG: zinc ribbon domain-containing protein [Haloferacaceae archaeon]